VIKFTTLFGLLAVEIAVTMTSQPVKTAIGLFFSAIALTFIYRSFYSMRIPEEKVIPLLPLDEEEPPATKNVFPPADRSRPNRPVPESLAANSNTLKTSG